MVFASQGYQGASSYDLIVVESEVSCSLGVSGDEAAVGIVPNRLLMLRTGRFLEELADSIHRENLERNENPPEKSPGCRSRLRQLEKQRPARKFKNSPEISSATSKLLCKYSTNSKLTQTFPTSSESQGFHDAGGRFDWKTSELCRADTDFLFSNLKTNNSLKRR